MSASAEPGRQPGNGSELENRFRAQWQGNAWSFLTLDDTARLGPDQVAYPDEFGTRYVYDSWVAHSRYVEEGDLAVVRDRDVVLGVGRIAAIQKTLDYKIRHRCPYCRSTDYKFRKTAAIPYRCSNCKHEFYETDKDDVGQVTVYSAEFAATFRELDGSFTVAELAPAYVNRSTQNAIRRLTFDAVVPMLEKHLVGDVQWMQNEDGPEIGGGFHHGIGKTRLGQQRFRIEMLGRFGPRCAFTGPQPPETLEAAHIQSFSSSPQHERSNGLLLRRDLHALFDRGLLTIDPGSWTIDVCPTLSCYPYIAELQGRQVQVPGHLRPNAEVVLQHATNARATWPGGGPESTNS